MYTRICALDGCGLEFQTDNKIKKHCCPAHSALNRVRRMRAKRRRGGGGGGGNGGGGGEPTLFDTITPVDSQQAFVPIPVIGPSESDRKPAVRASQKKREARRAAAA
jgi:hypothetical protein